MKLVRCSASGVRRSAFRNGEHRTSNVEPGQW